MDIGFQHCMRRVPLPDCLVAALENSIEIDCHCEESSDEAISLCLRNGRSYLSS